MKTVAEAMVEEERKAERRERIATAAMLGVVQIMPSAPNGVVARQAIGLADALIAELENETSGGA